MSSPHPWKSDPLNPNRIVDDRGLTVAIAVRVDDVAVVESAPAMRDTLHALIAHYEHGSNPWATIAAARRLVDRCLGSG